MTISPITRLDPFTPIASVTPFTTRDTDTFLTMLYKLRAFVVGPLQQYVDDISTSNTAAINTAVTDLSDKIDAAIAAFNTAIAAGDDAVTADLTSRIATVNASLASFSDELSAFDQRLTDMYATSNAGLDDRVTAAESKVDTYLTKTGILPGLPNPSLVPTEMLAELADTQNGSVTIDFATDSTGNDPTDWIRIWMQIFGPLLTDPKLRKVYNSWNATTQAWNAPVVDAAGTAVPASGGTIVADSFSRTGEVVGSVPNTGPAWVGKSGVWTADGTYAKQTSTTSTGALAVKCVNGYGNPIKNVSVSGYVSLVTSASAAAQQYRFMVGSPIMTSDNSGFVGGVYVTLAVSASGAVTWGLYSLINGVNTTIAVGPTIPGIVAASATPQAVTMTVTVNADRTVSATAQKDGQAAVSVNGSVSESDYAWMGGWAGVTSSTLATPGYSLDSINITSPSVPAPPQPGLTVWNGGVAGATLLYHKSRLSTMFPTKPDILCISIGHNYADLSTTEFIAIVDDFIAACNTQWGGLPKILIASQNPEGVNTAQANSGFHAARQAAIRNYAMSKGYQYLPVFERFTQLPTSAFNADGVHPSVPAAYPLAAGDTTVYGSVEWAKLMESFVDARRYKA